MVAEPESGFHKKPKTPKGEPPPEDPEGPGDEDEDMRVPLTNLSLHRHRKGSFRSMRIARLVVRRVVCACSAFASEAAAGESDHWP